MLTFLETGQNRGKILLLHRGGSIALGFLGFVSQSSVLLRIKSSTLQVLILEDFLFMTGHVKSHLEAKKLVVSVNECFFYF